MLTRSDKECTRGRPHVLIPAKGTTVFIYDRGTRHRWERIFEPEEGRDGKFIRKIEFYINSWKILNNGALLTCPPHSAIRDHCEQTCLGPVSYDDFNILAVAPDLVSLRILESLRIFKSKPKLNDSNSSFPLNIVL